MRRHALCSKPQNMVENTIKYEVEWFGMSHGGRRSEIVLVSKPTPFLVIIEKQKSFYPFVFTYFESIRINVHEQKIFDIFYVRLRAV